jgi:uncharacterized protein
MKYNLLRTGLIITIIFSFIQGEGQALEKNKKLTSQEKRQLEIVTQFHSERGYIKKFIESGMMSEDVEWFVPGPKNILPFAGLWKGVDGITEFNRLLDTTMRYDKVEIKEYIVDGDQVAAIFWGEGIAKSTGKVFKSEILRLYTFKNGKIIKVRNFYDTYSYVSAVLN